MKRDASWFFTAIGILVIITQGVIALANRRTASLFQDGAADQDAIQSNENDGAIREGEPPIIPRFKPNQDK